MVAFENLTVLRKLGVLLLVAFVALGAIGFSGCYYLQQSSYAMNTLYQERLIPVKNISEDHMLLVSNKALLLELMLSKDNARNNQIKNTIENNSKQSDVNLEEVKSIRMDDQAKNLLERMESFRAKWRDLRKQVISLVLQNKNAEAYAFYLANLDATCSQYQNAMHEFSNYYTEQSQKVNADNQAALAKAKQISMGILLAAVLLLGWTGWYITKIITRPLRQMVGLCEEMADGDFRARPDQPVRQDELGQLAGSLAIMRSKLRVLMKAIELSVEQVAASAEQLTASADQSAQASTQVAGSIVNVAAGHEPSTEYYRRSFHADAADVRGDSTYCRQCQRDVGTIGRSRW